MPRDAVEVAGSNPGGDRDRHPEDTGTQEAPSRREAVDETEDSAEVTVAADEVEAPSAGGEIETPPLAEIQLALADARERLLRSLADFDNYKKRAERERSDLRRFAAIEPLKDFLPILDNLELAMSSKGSFEDLKSGVDLIVSQMKKLLARFGVAEIVAEGQPFDPSRHDAIARFEDASVSEQTVAEELQKGYLIKGRLLRAAMVRVAVPIDSKEEVEEGPD